MLHDHLPAIPQSDGCAGRGATIQVVHATVWRVHRDGGVHAAVPDQRVHGLLPRTLLSVQLPDRLHRHPHLLPHVLRPPHRLLARQVGLVVRGGRPPDRPAGDHRRRGPGQEAQGPGQDLLYYRVECSVCAFCPIIIMCTSIPRMNACFPPRIAIEVKITSQLLEFVTNRNCKCLRSFPSP